ncbi:MAG: hypothetical protein JSR77_14375 [Planctomycetes bacterium]|nr:hypothetical protein [Planctomycetota bacterium]
MCNLFQLLERTRSRGARILFFTALIAVLLALLPPQLCIGVLPPGPIGVSISEGGAQLGLRGSSGFYPGVFVSEIEPAARYNWWARLNVIGGMPSLHVPFWLIALAFADAGLLLERRTRCSFGIGRCDACGYDRKGLAARLACPECGAAETPATCGAPAQ